MTTAPRALMVYCTCPDSATAEALASLAVEQALAACVSQVADVRSTFVWQDAVTRETEVMLIAKTTPAAFPALETLWREAHCYELPEIIAVPIAYASEAYLAWIESTVAC